MLACVLRKGDKMKHERYAKIFREGIAQRLAKNIKCDDIHVFIPEFNSKENGLNMEIVIEPLYASLGSGPCTKISIAFRTRFRANEISVMNGDLYLVKSVSNEILSDKNLKSINKFYKAYSKYGKINEEKIKIEQLKKEIAKVEQGIECLKQ